MKTFIFVLTLMSCVLIGNVEGAHSKRYVNVRKQVVAQTAKNERQLLINNCNVIRSNIANQFAGMGAGALNSSGFRNAVKQGITNYLNSVGTPTARQLLSELQANGFQGFL